MKFLEKLGKIVDWTVIVYPSCKEFIKGIWNSKSFFLWATFIFSLGSFYFTTQYQTANNATTEVVTRLLDFNSKYYAFISTSRDAQMVSELSKAVEISTNTYPQEAYKAFLEIVPIFQIPTEEIKDVNSVTTYEILKSATDKYYPTFSAYNSGLQTDYSLQTSDQNFWYKLLTKLQILGLLSAFRLAYLESKSSKNNLAKQNDTNQPS